MVNAIAVDNFKRVTPPSPSDSLRKGWTINPYDIECQEITCVILVETLIALICTYLCSPGFLAVARVPFFSETKRARNSSATVLRCAGFMPINQWQRGKISGTEGYDFVTCRICGDRRRVISGLHLSKHDTDGKPTGASIG
jgi:hypothetical protein